MYCPTCRSEYRPGFSRCDDCDQDLVHELAPLEEDAAGNPYGPGLARVLSTYDHGEVMLTKPLLDGEEIVHHALGELFTGSGIYITPVYLYVAEGDLERARELLRDNGITPL
jgi:hypothetical protein